MNTHQTCSAAFDWLARAQAAPEQAHKEWMQTGIALLPLGKRFNSVYLPAPLVHVALGTSDSDDVVRALAELLGGPVIHNRPQHQYYALVELTNAQRWTQEYPQAPMLGAGQFLSVPASDLTGPTGLYWTVRPRIVGDLCAIPSVAALVHMARDPRRAGAR
ncbi:hypothetical protein DEJ48_27295 [Streptomyces venezuelae]|uniref:DNA primase/polymerase bifunctional N-terminal domain-containing protein n=2 Tax=Streptomyces venezuelae TaxID=54571 RepID=A0A5P2C249_STRVZ|nr:hypothetical protein DEJ48_27295 [Streptomyces venezuelae]